MRTGMVERAAAPKVRIRSHQMQQTRPWWTCRRDRIHCYHPSLLHQWGFHPPLVAPPHKKTLLTCLPRKSPSLSGSRWSSLHPWSRQLLPSHPPHGWPPSGCSPWAEEPQRAARPTGRSPGGWCLSTLQSPNLPLPRPLQCSRTCLATQAECVGVQRGQWMGVSGRLTLWTRAATCWRNSGSQSQTGQSAVAEAHSETQQSPAGRQRSSTLKLLHCPTQVGKATTSHV